MMKTFTSLLCKLLCGLTMAATILMCMLATAHLRNAWNEQGIRTERLISAITNGDRESVTSLLLERSRQLIHFPLTNSYPLHLAIRLDRSDMVKHMLELGESLDSWLGPSLLQQAVQCCNDEILQLLLHAGAPHSRSLVHLAVRTCSLSTLSLLLQHGVDADTVDENWNTPLHLAVRLNRPEMVTALLAMKPSEKVKSQCLEFIGITLFSGGVTAHARDAHCNQPINLAIAMNEVAMVQQLAAVPITLTTQTCDGLTPLDQAVLYGRSELVKVLLQAGAVASSYTLNLSVKQGSLDTLSLLAQDSTMLAQILMSSIPLGQNTVAKWALQNGAEPQAQALDMAIQHRNSEILKVLLETHPHVSEDWSPLMRACQVECAACAALLLEYDLRTGYDSFRHCAASSIAPGMRSLAIAV